MKQCPRCKSAMRPGDSFCRFCGYIQRKHSPLPPSYLSSMSLTESPSALSTSPFAMAKHPVFVKLKRIVRQISGK